MKILDLRIPSHLLSDSNTDSIEETEESSFAVEGHYTLEGADNIFDGSTVNPDGHECQNNSVTLDMQIKNLFVSDINQNFSAMETDNQDMAITASATLPTKEARPATSNPIPPVDKLDDMLDFEEDSGSEEQRERKKKKARRGSGKAKKEAKKKEQEERKKKEEQQQHSPEKLVTISSEEYQFLKQQGDLVLSLIKLVHLIHLKHLTPLIHLTILALQ